MHSVLCSSLAELASLAFRFYDHLFMYLIFFIHSLINFIMSKQVFGNFVSTAVQSNQLGEGSHAVRVYSIEQTNSFLNSDGSEKKEERLWTNPSKQVLVKFCTADMKTWHTHRFQMDAWRKADTLTKAELKSGKFEVAGRYAIDSKTRERIVDEEGVAKCMNIINEFFNALKMVEGSSDITPAILDARLLTIKIVNKPYLDEEQLRITSFKMYKEPVEKEDFTG